MLALRVFMVGTLALIGGERAIGSDARWPSWYPDARQDKEFAGQLVASACARESSNPSLSQEYASTQARKKLAESIRTQVESSNHIEEASHENGGDVQDSSTFEVFTTQVTKEVLIGSKIIRAVEHENDKGRWICVVVGIEKTSAQEALRAAATRVHLPPVQLQGAMQKLFASLPDKQLQ